MAENLTSKLPAILLVLVGLAIVAGSGAAFYGHAAPFHPQDSYDANDADYLDGQVYRFEELSPGAQNLTQAALQSDIATRSPVPPEFEWNRTDENATEQPDAIEGHVAYYIHYQGDFHRLAASANRSTVSLVNASIGYSDTEFYAFSELTEGEQEAVGRAMNSSEVIYGPTADGFPHFEATHAPESGKYVVYRPGNAFAVDVDPGTGPQLWLLVVIPAFGIGIFSVGIGLVTYSWSATVGPTALLAGLVALFGPSVLTELGLVEPVDDLAYFALVPLVVTGSVYLLLHLFLLAWHQRS